MITATVIPIAPGDLVSQVIAPPLITNEALSSSAMSVIAHQEIEKYTDLFGYNWQQSQSGLGGPNIPLQTVIANPADLGKPPQPLSYYFGAAGWYCLNANPFAVHYQPVSAGLPAGIKCDTIYDDYYRPWVQIPSTMKSVHHWSTCNLMFGWDPPIALTAAATVAGPSVGPGQVSATKTTESAATPTPPTPGSPSITVTTPTAVPDHVTGGDTTSSKSADPSQDPPPEPSDATTTGSPADPSQKPPPKTGDDTTASKPLDPSQQPPSQSAYPTAASPAFLTPIDSPTPLAPAQQITTSADETTNMPPAVIGTIGSGGAAATIVSDPSQPGQVIATSAGGATTLHAGDEGNIASQYVSVDKTAGVVVHSATTVQLGSGVGTSQDPAGGASAIQVGGQTLTVGGPAYTVSGQVYSALPSGGLAVGSGDSQKTLTVGSNGQIGLADGQTTSVYQMPVANTPGGVVISGQTLTAGGSAFTVNGATYSVPPSASGVVVMSDGTTSTLSPQPGVSVLSLGNGQHATIPSAPGRVLIDGQTLTAGGSAATINGATYSALPSASGIVVMSDGTTTTQSPQSGESVVTLGDGQHATIISALGGSEPGSVTKINGQAVTPITNGIVVDGTTMTAGGATQTIGGMAYSLQSGGQLVVVGSSTLGNDGGIGDLIGAMETLAESMAHGNATSIPSIASGSSPTPTMDADGSHTTIAPSIGGSSTVAAFVTSSTQSAASYNGWSLRWETLALWLAVVGSLCMA